MKILDTGVAVLEKDSHVSRWVEQNEGKLDIAVPLLTPFRHLIPEGGAVIDVGAMIGDHTITYAQWVGPKGIVHAFEPLWAAFVCLVHNMTTYPQVAPYCLALGAQNGIVRIHREENAGRSWLAEEGTQVPMMTLDIFQPARLDFLKIDAEGCEPAILRGGRETIAKFKPAMLVEVNAFMLEKQGETIATLVNLLDNYGYTYRTAEEGLMPAPEPSKEELPIQCDLICIHKTKI
jgi:FkbM family methyltransferase